MRYLKVLCLDPFQTPHSFKTQLRRTRTFSPQNKKDPEHMKSVGILWYYYIWCREGDSNSHRVAPGGF